MAPTSTPALRTLPRAALSGTIPGHALGFAVTRDPSSPLWERMIFVVGARRSGTNLVERVLSVHPDVATIRGETYLFSDGIAPLAARVHHGARGSSRLGALYADESVFLDAVRGLCDALFLGYVDERAPRPVRLVERTPEHVHHLDLIGRVYPDAAVVHVVRDGRDVARSVRAHAAGPRTITGAGREWRSAVEAARRADPPARFVELRYEDLVLAPEPTLTGLYEQLELPCTPDTVRAAVAESREWYNVDPRSPAVGVAKWRTAMSRRDLRAFMAVAGDTLVDLGYEAASPPPSPVARTTAAALSSLADTARHALVRPSANLEADVVKWLTDQQVVVDDVLGTITGGRWERLRALLKPDARVRFVGREGEWEKRGEDAVRELVAALGADPALSGRQIRGDVFPALPTFTVVLTYESPDGTMHRRLLMLHLEAGIVAALEWYSTAD